MASYRYIKHTPLPPVAWREPDRQLLLAAPIPSIRRPLQPSWAHGGPSLFAVWNAAKGLLDWMRDRDDQRPRAVYTGPIIRPKPRGSEGDRLNLTRRSPNTSGDSPMRKPITDVLQFLKQNEDDNVSYIVAGALNLYIENMKRINGRNYFEIRDVKQFIDVLVILLGEQMMPKMDEDKFEEAIREPVNG